MTVKITKVNDPQDRTVLKVEGKLMAQDAEMLERMFEVVENGQRAAVDLSGVTFIDSDGAAILRRLERKSVELKGADFFIQSIIDAYTKEGKGESDNG